MIEYFLGLIDAVQLMCKKIDQQFGCFPPVYFRNSLFANAREKRKLRECPEDNVSRKKLKGIIDEVEVLVKPLAIAAK